MEDGTRLSQIERPRDDDWEDGGASRLHSQSKLAGQVQPGSTQRRCFIDQPQSLSASASRFGLIAFANADANANAITTVG